MSVDTEANKSYLARLAELPDVEGIWPKGNGALTNFGEATYNCVMAFADAVRRAGSTNSESLVQALENVRIQGPQGELVMDPETHHAHVNSYLARCELDGTFTIVEEFGRIPPEIPARYKELFETSSFGLTTAPAREASRLAREMAQMQAKQEEAQRILDVTDTAILVTDGRGIITAVNKNTADIFGYAEDELVGAPLHLLLPPHLRRRHEELFRAFVDNSHQEQRMGKRGDITGYRKDGTFISLEASIGKFKSETWLGTGIYLAGYDQD